jgi:flagellar protein FlgJ
MYDQQLAVDMAQNQGIGLAEVLKRQLGGGIASPYRDLAPADYLGMPIIAQPAAVTGETAQGSAASGEASIELDGSPEAFIENLWQVAQRAATELDLAPEALLAQAALETGWGGHVMRHRDGASSHNLFGIKADSRWQGERVQVSTLEYRDGVPLKTRADFRAYDSFAASFGDYVDFLQRNPRYKDALQQTGDPKAYFSALQQAGYATDPAYADKIHRILDSDAMQRAKRSVSEEGADTI